MTHYYTSSPGSFETGNAPASSRTTSATRDVTEKEKVDLWFCDQLLAMKGDDAFVCMAVCFPLIEVMIRHELKIPDEQDVALSDNSPALHWFASFMTIPDVEARKVWGAFRNGLLHRAMIKDTIVYVLTGEKSDRPAVFKGGTITVYVWHFRDVVVARLRTHHRHLWAGSSSPLPGIYRVLPDPTI